MVYGSTRALHVELVARAAMRHGVAFRKLGRSLQHRRALLKNMARSLIKHERIVTTLAKAKEMKRVGDKVVHLGKTGTPQAKRTAWNWLQHEDLVSKVFGPLRDRYVNRPGGYTRVLRIPNRKGDNAPMAILELVDNGLPLLRDTKVHASATQPPSMPAPSSSLPTSSKTPPQSELAISPEGTPV